MYLKKTTKNIFLCITHVDNDKTTKKEKYIMHVDILLQKGDSLYFFSPCIINSFKVQNTHSNTIGT